jgi:hypothetical protein
VTDTAHLVVIDCEGNGQHPLPDLVEVGWLPIVDGAIGEPVSWLVRPRDRSWPWPARDVLLTAALFLHLGAAAIQPTLDLP